MSSQWQSIGPDEAKHHPLYGVKGWLAVFAVGTLLGVLKEVGGLNGEANRAGLTLGQFFALDLPFVTFIKTVLAVEVASVSIVYWLLFTKHPKFRPVTTGVMLFTFPLIFAIGIASQVNEFAGQLVMGFFTWAISCAVWVTYLQRSERVRVTFEHCVRVSSSHALTPAHDSPRSFVNPTPVAMPVPVRAPISSNISSAPSQLIGNQCTDKVALASVTPTQPLNETLSPTLMTLDKSTDEDHWATAMNEVESGQRRPGLWAKAFAESEGDETKAKVAYLKSRVQQLTEVAQAQEAQREAQRQEGLAKAQAAVLVKQQSIEQAIAQFVSTGTVSLDQLRLIVHQADKARVISLLDSVKGNTLLHVCAENGMVEEVNALLMAGADPQLSNNKGLRPEFVSKNAFVSALIREGALPSEKVRRVQELGIGFDGKVFTYEGFRCDHIDDAIAHVEKVRREPDPFLLRNVIDGNWTSVKSRLEQGLEPTGRDGQGKTLLDHAKANNDKLMIALLESHGA